MTKNLSRPAKQRFWENHVTQCGQSELTQAEYCRLNKINANSFEYWKRKIDRSSLPALVEVPFPQSLTVSGCSVSPRLWLVLGQRYRIEIGNGFDPEDLERLIRVLERI